MVHKKDKLEWKISLDCPSLAFLPCGMPSTLPRHYAQVHTCNAIVVLRLKDKAVEDVVDSLADEGPVHHELACIEPHTAACHTRNSAYSRLLQNMTSFTQELNATMVE